ncbi:hypothetical protein MMC11_005639 [Xylographa trunciseda]|nr:hypothetical protein [Xylographa trunciseda]
MADNFVENMSTNATPVQEDKHIMDVTLEDNVEKNLDADATPVVHEKPLFYVGSFEPSARLTKLLNEVVAQKPIEEVEDPTLSKVLPNSCPTPRWTTSSLPRSMFYKSSISPPTPEFSKDIVDVAMQDDTKCPTPFYGPPTTFDSLASTPLSDVLSDPMNISTLEQQDAASKAADLPTTDNVTSVVKENVQDTLFSTSVAANEKIAPHLNATNQYIVHLRDEIHYGWGHIAAMLNSQPEMHPLPESGTPATSATPFTPSAVYSRYIRTKYHLRVAADAAETLARQQTRAMKRKRPAARRGSTATVDSNDSDFNAREKVSKSSKAIITTVTKGPMVWEEHMDNLLRVAVKEVKAEFWEDVAKRVVEKKGSVVQPSECAKRFVEVQK